ncbi:MAG: hypothetical protein ACRDH9_00745 [Actinomycetota bacterium]
MQQLIRFAESPQPESFAAVPFAESVWLGLSRRLVVNHPREMLADPSSWVLSAPHFRAYVGPFSALDLLAEMDARFGPDAPPAGSLEVNVGPHPHCASPPVPPPARLKDLRRVSAQPTDIDSCILWWTVDAFVDVNGTIRAITLDLWEP